MWNTLIKRLVASGLTQSQIGDKVGLSQPTISNLANGEYKRGPHGDAAIKLQALAAALLVRSKRK